MADEVKKKGLGRGLSALLGEAIEAVIEPTSNAVAGVRGEQGEEGRSNSSIRTLPIELLQPGKYQPRRRFDDDKIADLVQSIRERGILQPILVRPVAGEKGRYEIIAGERRWRAGQKAQLHEVPVIIRDDLTDRDALEVALVENLQRQDLTPLEEADGYCRLMEEFQHTQEDLAKAVGKSRSHVANMMRLLGLPDPVKDMVDRGALSAGHARALLTAADPEALAHQVLDQGLSVRETEKLAQEAGGKPKSSRSRKEPPEKDADTAALERDLTALLGLKVEIRGQGKGGELVISYGTLEQLDDILGRLSNGG